MKIETKGCSIIFADTIIEDEDEFNNHEYRYVFDNKHLKFSYYEKNDTLTVVAKRRKNISARQPLLL